MRPIKSVMFDIGGVLLGSANTQIREVLTAWTGLDISTLRRTFAEQYKMVEKGRMRDDEAYELVKLRLELSAPVPQKELDDAWQAGSQPVEAMFDLATRLRGHGLRVGLLSNTQFTHVRLMKAMGFASQFEPVIFSCDVNERKPEPGIYTLAVRTLNLEPDEIVFIDDLLANVEGARAVGIQAVWHQDIASTIDQVERLVGLRV